MKQKNKRVILNHIYFYALIFLLCISPLQSYASLPNTTDLVIFSYDRPLQLHTLLCSTEKYVTHLHTISVIYRTSNADFKNAYRTLEKLFPYVQFIKQGSNPKKDFKPLLLETIDSTIAPYVVFATDDDIFTDSIDMTYCANALQLSNAYGFYLRLGMNITHSYFSNQTLKLPTLTPLDAHTVSFSFQDGKSYWAYPNNVNMTLYKKTSISDALSQLSYQSPNILESRWARFYPRTDHGLCFIASKGINIPLNLVQDDWHNKHEAIFSPQDLLILWQNGLTIDIEQFHAIKNNAAHMPYIPNFIYRK